MYYEHFGLNQAPFKITPDTRLFYPGGARGEVLEALIYAVTNGDGIVKVVGEVGSGKTMLSRMLEERLPEQVEIVYLANPSISPEAIPHAIALELKLDVAADSSRLEVMHLLQQGLLERHAANRQVVVFVEEAQGMRLDTLEEIRLLSNLETQHDKLLQIVLFGQPELEQNLDAENIRQLRERIVHSFTLAPLTEPEIRAYLNFRLRAAGYRGPELFGKRACRKIARASLGLIRRINILGDKCLLAAFAAGIHDISVKQVQVAIRDTEFGKSPKRSRMPEFALASGLILILLSVGITLWQGGFFLPDDTLAPKALSAAPHAAPVTPPRVSVPEQVPPTAPAVVADVAGTAVSIEPAPVVPAMVEKTLALAPGHASVPEKISLPIAPPAIAQHQVPVISEQLPEAVPAKPPVIADVSTEALTPPKKVVSGDDLVNQRLRASKAWLQIADGNHYSIQLLVTKQTQRAHLEEFLERWQRRNDLEQIYVYQTMIDGLPGFGVLYNEFPSMLLARRALAALPHGLQRHRPFIRNVRDIETLG